MKPLDKALWIIEDKDLNYERYLKPFTEASQSNKSVLSTMRSMYPNHRSLFAADTWDDNSGERHRIQNAARQLCNKNEIARNIRNNYLFFILGGGIRVEFDEKDTERKKRAEEKWSIFAQRNKWNDLSRGIVENVLTLGEWLIVEPKWDSIEEQQTYRKQGVPILRWIDPTYINDIELDSDDPWTPTIYNHTTAGDIDAERVIHFKINNPLGLHGRPILEPVIYRILQYDSMLEDRVAESNIRSRTPFIRTVSGKNATQRPPSELPERGLVLTAFKNEKGVTNEDWVRPPSATGTSRDLMEEMRSILLAICQGVQLSEFLVTNDLSRAGAFGQIPIARIQVSKNMEGIQDQLKDPFVELVHRVVGEVVDRDSIRIIYEEPDFSTEDRKVDLVDRLMRTGLLPKRRALEMLGYDADQIIKELDEEAKSLQGTFGAESTPAPSLGGPSDFASQLSALGAGTGPTQIGDFQVPDFGSAATPATASTPEVPSTLPPSEPLPSPTTRPQIQFGQPSPSPSGALRFAPQPEIRFSTNPRGEAVIQFGGSSITVPAGNSIRFAENINFYSNGQPSDNHITAPADPSDYDEVYIGMDFGWDMPGTLIVGGLRHGRLFIPEEHVITEMPILHTEPHDEVPSSPEEADCWVCLLRYLITRYPNVQGIFTDPKDPEHVSMMSEVLPLPVEPVSFPVEERTDIVMGLAKQNKILVHTACQHLHQDFKQGKGHCFDGLSYLCHAIIGRGKLSLE